MLRKKGGALAVPRQRDAKDRDPSNRQYAIASLVEFVALTISRRCALLAITQSQLARAAKFGPVYGLSIAKTGFERGREGDVERFAASRH
jgi:hypothetical protein